MSLLRPWFCSDRYDRCHQRRPLFRRIVLLGLAWTLGAAVWGAAQSAPSREHQLKAAFLYNFTKFVEWPETAFNDPGSPIVIGVLGNAAVRDELAKIVQGRAVNGRKILVKPATLFTEEGIHVLFVGGALAEEQVAGAEQLPPRTAVLTVGETEKANGPGAIITFTREADKVRFIIDLDAAEHAGLKLSAQLLKLAAEVRRKP